MNRYNFITIMALIIILMALPVYGLREAARLNTAQAKRQTQLVNEGVTLYLENCADCHDIDGSGLGVMPALNLPNLKDADPELLTKAIARATHGSKMAAWHVEEGGSLTDYQIESLVTLIQFAKWNDVAATAVSQDFILNQPATIELIDVTQEDPHRCAACHEQPDVHVNQFGLDCTRCHSLKAWTPALLTRHTFALDHGNEGQVACETCHTETYAQHTCYSCHEHQPEEMINIHEKESVFNIDACIDCHPTGAPGEAQLGIQTQIPTSSQTGIVFNHD